MPVSMTATTTVSDPLVRSQAVIRFAAPAAGADVVFAGWPTGTTTLPGYTLAGGNRFHCFSAKSASVGASNGLIATSGSAYSTIGSLARRAAAALASDRVKGVSNATCEELSLTGRTALTPTPAIFESDRTYAPP